MFRGVPRWQRTRDRAQDHSGAGSKAELALGRADMKQLVCQEARNLPGRDAQDHGTGSARRLQQISGPHRKSGGENKIRSSALSRWWSSRLDRCQMSSEVNDTQPGTKIRGG